GKRTGAGRAVGSDRAATASRAAETERRQASRGRSGGLGRHSLRPQERHPLGDAPQGDGLRVGEHVLAEAARLAGGGRVAPAAPGPARPPRRGRPHRLVEGVLGLGERAGKKGGERVGKNPTDRGKPGSKRHLVSDRRGVPLAV
ncbi:MAG: Mobile element protein, partial [uncultured Rubrobacteraceae bacterium]